MERGKSGVTAEYAKNADPFMRANRSSLPLDGIAGAGDRRREADAVLSVTDVVVHRLRNGNDLDAELVELGGIAECVVAADYDQMFDAKRRVVRQYLLGDIPGLLALRVQRGRKV